MARTDTDLAKHIDKDLGPLIADEMGLRYFTCKVWRDNEQKYITLIFKYPKFDYAYSLQERFRVTDAFQPMFTMTVLADEVEDGNSPNYLKSIVNVGKNHARKYDVTSSIRAIE